MSEVSNTQNDINEKAQEKNFDQFYTQDSIAVNCLEMFLKCITKVNLYKKVDDLFFLEPSAGGGAFLRALEKRNIKSYFGCDIDPNCKGVTKKNFLSDDISGYLKDKETTVVIGNPPFGKRARLAADFLNNSFKYSDTVGFILPLQFQKYSAQNKIVEEARLIFDEVLPRNSFVFNGKDYPVRCCFQVWTKLPNGKDVRFKTTPITKHEDFDMWQYNNTREAEKYFDKEKYGWDFAIPRQGYKDYTLKETDPKKMDHHTQWIFFKAKTPEVLERLKQIDYTKLSHKNISIPGFGKADVITEYKDMFGDTSIVTKTPELLVRIIDKNEGLTDEKNDVMSNLSLDNCLTRMLADNPQNK